MFTVSMFQPYMQPMHLGMGGAYLLYGHMGRVAGYLPDNSQAG